jgi:hypothetical protein
MTEQVIPAQPGLWLALVTDGELYEEPLVGWQVNSSRAYPITATFVMNSGEPWAIRYPDGTYWLRGIGRLGRDDVLRRWKKFEEVWPLSVSDILQREAAE